MLCEAVTFDFTNVFGRDPDFHTKCFGIFSQELF